MRYLLIRNDDATSGVAAFEKEFGMQGKAAVDTPLPPPTMPAGNTIPAGPGGFFRIKEEPATETPPVPEPVFQDALQAEPEVKKPSTVKGLSIETFLKVRNSLQSELLALVAKTKTPEKYALDDEQLNLLAEAYAPYADTITGSLPPWVMIVAIEAITTGKKVLMAFEDRKTAERNAKVVAGKMAPSVQPQSTVVDKSRPRTRWTIRTTGPYAGTYQEDRFGKYMKKEDPGEMVELSNKADMQEVIFKNGWDTVRQVFNLPADWREKNGIEIDED